MVESEKKSEEPLRTAESKEILKLKDEGDALEAVLNHVGAMGRYIKWLLLAMGPLGVGLAFIYSVQMFVAATPQRHWCRVPELKHLDMELRRNLSAPGAATGEEWERCLTFEVNWTQVLETLSPPSPDTPTVPCQHGWEFELGDIPYHTIVSERGWVCEYASYAPTAQSIFFLGSIVGGLLFGWMADEYGRVPALIVANIAGLVGSVGSLFTVGLWDFALARFVVGLACDNGFMLMYILVLEYLSPQYRTVAANLCIAIYFGGGSVALPWLALWIGDWRQLIFFTSLPLLVVVGANSIVPESARWLVSRGRVKKAVEVLRKFERVNRTRIPEHLMENFITSARHARRTDESIVALFKSPPLRLMMIYLVVVYMAGALVFDGLVRMSETLGLDFFLTFTLTSAAELPSIAVLILLLDRWGRRRLAYGPLIISGVLTVIAAFSPKGIPQVTMAILSRFFINMSFSAITQWIAELLPTGVRASGCSLLHISGYASTMVSPFVVYSGRYWGPLPLLILGILALMMSGMVLLLPETKGLPMTQTIADGEKLVRGFSICSNTKTDVEMEDMKDKTKSLITKA